MSIRTSTEEGERKWDQKKNAEHLERKTIDKDNNVNKKKDILIDVSNHIFLKSNTHIELSVIRKSLALRTNKF